MRLLPRSTAGQWRIVYLVFFVEVVREDEVISQKKEDDTDDELSELIETENDKNDTSYEDKISFERIFWELV